MDSPEVKKITDSIIEEASKRLVGFDQYLKKILICIWAQGNILLEGNPGLAKTLAASTIAEILGIGFGRIQFTPDLMPSDITGVNVFNQKTREFEFLEGPVFTNLLLCDEINRAPPKTQAALLEAMQEHQVSVEGDARVLPHPFIVIATQNPLENAGVYPLPEAQQDRFIIRLLIDFPDRETEKQMLKLKRDQRAIPVNKIIGINEILAIQDYIHNVKVSEEVLEYILNIVTATRDNRSIELGVSPRASIALLHLGKATAAINGRNYVQPDDLKFIAFEILNHRLVLSHEAELDRVKPIDIIVKLLEESKVEI